MEARDKENSYVLSGLYLESGMARKGGSVSILALAPFHNEKTSPSVYVRTIFAPLPFHSSGIS